MQSFLILVVIFMYFQAFTIENQQKEIERLQKQNAVLVCISVEFIKDLGHLWLGYIRIMHISWDTCHRVLTKPILEGSKIALNGPIDLI